VRDLQARLKSQGAVFEWIKPALPGSFYQDLFRRYEAGSGKRALVPGE